MNTGVIIARFQSPYLHEGHTLLIDKVKLRHDKLIIVLGISPIMSRKNPFDYFTRESMVKQLYPNVIVLPLSDDPDDKVWSQRLDSLLNSSFPAEQFTLYGGRDSFIPYYVGKFKTIELPDSGNFNATELRERYSDKVHASKDFRAGILYALHNQYTKVYPTVDIAVFRKKRSEILLGKKANSPQWRLIGGFVDPTDDNYEAAALRELKEEAGDIEVSAMQYELSHRVDDWRYRKEADQIITTVFSCDLSAGTPMANDDIIEVGWIKMADLPSLIAAGDINKAHQPILEQLN